MIADSLPAAYLLSITAAPGNPVSYLPYLSPHKAWQPTLNHLDLNSRGVFPPLDFESCSLDIYIEKGTILIIDNLCHCASDGLSRYADFLIALII